MGLRLCCILGATKHEETRLYLLRMEGEEIHCRLGIFDLRLGRDRDVGDECQVTSDFNDLNHLDLVVLREPWNLLWACIF